MEAVDPISTTTFSARLTQLWESTTVMTWLSFAARSISPLVVLPLVTTHFSKAENLLWLFFLTLAGLQLMADFGFGPSFVRAIAYARGGRAQLDSLEGASDTPNVELLGRVNRVLHRAYRYLTLGGFVLAAIFGTWAAIRPVSLLGQPAEGWIAWAVVLFCNAQVFRNGAYSIWLQGMNRVAHLRRIETLLAFCSTTLTAITIAVTSNFLVSIIVAQVLTAAATYGVRILAQRIVPVAKSEDESNAEDREVFRFIWPAAWRSGVGVLMSSAILQASPLVYAQFGDPSRAASFLLAMRVMQMLIQVAMAPFYSKIPWFASLYGRGQRQQLIPAARAAMEKCHWVFAYGVVGIAFSANPILHALHANVTFVPETLWLVMGLAYMVERIGAMHMQFYSLSNHILWHIANGISGVIYVTAAALLVPRLDAYAFPVAMLIAYLSFYTWFAARLVYRHYAVRPWQFEARSSLRPFGLIVLAAIVVMLKPH